MHRFLGISCAFTVVLLAHAPAHAITAKEKMVTCKFGANDQKLQGKQRAEFLKRCMSNVDDPRGPAAGAPRGGGAPRG